MRATATPGGRFVSVSALLLVAYVSSVYCEQTQTSANFNNKVSQTGPARPSAPPEPPTSSSTTLITKASAPAKPKPAPEQETASATNDDQLLLGFNRADGGLSGPLRANSRLLAVPLSLARFMFPHSRPGERRQSAALMDSFGPSNNKRSDSQMDALTGLTGLGKRSVPVEYINLEPIFGRQNLVRNPGRIQTVRWAPLDAVEAPIMATDY
jgi:hypothetical protein